MQKYYICISSQELVGEELTVSLLQSHQQGADSLPDRIHRSPVLRRRPYFCSKDSTAFHFKRLAMHHLQLRKKQEEMLQQKPCGDYFISNSEHPCLVCVATGRYGIDVGASISPLHKLQPIWLLQFYLIHLVPTFLSPILRFGRLGLCS